MAVGRAPGSPSSFDGALVGRRDLVDDLVAAAADARAGSGSLHLLTGEAGIGKTSVARALDHAVRDSIEVTWGNCSPDRSAPPFWPWREVLRSTDVSPAADGSGSASTAIGAARFELLTALADELVECAEDQPVLHVIEDLHWADVASVLLLAHVGASIPRCPLMVLATLRTGEVLTPQLGAALEEVRRCARGTEVLPLRDGDVAELVGAAGIVAGDGLSSLLHERTGGNPLFVTEVLRSVGTGDPTRRMEELVAGSVPARVSELVENRLGRLPPAVADAVTTASVIGAEGSLRTLAAVQDADLDATIDLAEQARAARLFDAAPAGRWQFRHELVRDAVHTTMPDSVRATKHAAVLEVLGADPATPEAVLAQHALAAQPLFDAERAVALAARAGESALAHHAYEEAVTWFERALEAAPSGLVPRWRADLLVQRGEALRHLGDIEQARVAFVQAADLTDDPALLARAALGHADPGADLGIAYRTEDPVTGTLLERAIAAQPDDVSVTQVLLESRLGAELYFSDEPDRARSLCQAALHHAHQLGDRRALCAAGAVDHDAYVVGQADLETQLQGSEQLLEWAAEDGGVSARLTAHRARVLDQLAAGDLVGMDREVLAFQRLAEPLGTPGYLWWPALWAAMRALLEGHHELAEARAAGAFEIGSLPFATLAFTNLSFLLFFLRREQGRLAEMEQAVRDHAASHADVPAIRVALAVLLAELDRHDEARGVLRTLADDELDRLQDRNWPASWFQLARATFLVDDTDLAARLLDEVGGPSERSVNVSLATACLGSTELGYAWLLHGAGRLDAADARYRAATSANTGLGARSWLVQAQVDHVQLLLDRDRDGDREAARELLAQAASLADDIGLAVVGPSIGRSRRRLDPAALPTVQAGAAKASFRRAGAVWEVEFAGRSAQVPHARGLTDLAILLARPGEAVPVLELVAEPGAGSTAARGAPAFDDRARREIKTRLQELDDDVAEAEARGDSERAALAREERQQLAEAVARDLGLGGKSRRIGDPVERARKTVSMRIRRAITAVGRAHPELGRHLERSIDTGTWCAYRPAEPTTWTT